jgi:hypothetical protein
MAGMNMAKLSAARTRNERTGTALAVMAGSLLSMTTAFGQAPGSVTVEVSKCLDLKSPDERLACFEAQVAAAGRATDPRPATAAPEAGPAETQPAAAGTKQVRVEELGRPAETRQAQGAATPRPAGSRGDARHEQSNDVQEFEGTVTALRETVPNNWVITLDNGQVWRQTQPQWYPLKPGHQVRISSTRWGSAFRLSVEELKGFIAVARVR